MHTEFWKGIAAFVVWRLGEKKPIEFGSETQIQKTKERVKKSGCGLPTRREREQEKE
jgi:hypothetical protein